MSKTLATTTTTTVFPLTLKLRHLSPSPSPSPKSTFLFFSPQNTLRLVSSACSYTRRSTSSGDDDVDGEFDLNWIRSKRRMSWWSDVDTEPESSYGFVQEFLDSIWIFKVFRFYGWWLLPVFISMLLATGLKAFLLALAVPIGLSIVALPLNKLWAIIDDPKRKKAKKEKKKKKPRVRTKSNIDIEEEWLPNDEGKRNEGGEDSSSFKGWDELDRTKEFDEERMRRPVRGGRSRGEGRFIRRER